MTTEPNNNKANGKKGSDTKSGRVWPGRCSVVSQTWPGRHQATASQHQRQRQPLKTSKPLTVGCWNVRTLLDTTSSACPERRSALIAKELQRYNLDIVALSETRLSGEGNLIEHSAGYTFYWKGRDMGLKREAGVAFAVKTSMVKCLEEIPSGVSDRLMTMRLPLAKGRYVTLVSVYAPTMAASDNEKLSFYQSLKGILRNIPMADKIIVLGDFNARVGRDHETWSGLGRHGVGGHNSNGLLLLQLCEELGLCITNTMFQQKNKYKTTWMHPGSKQWHLLDYILVRRRDIREVCKVRVLRGAECWTDHRLVRAKLRLAVRGKVRSAGVTVPKKLNVSRLKDENTKREFQNAMDGIELGVDWPSFKESLYGVASQVLGHVKKKHQDWFDQNDIEIEELLLEKRNLVSSLLRGNLPLEERVRLDTMLKDLKAKVQRKLRDMRDKWWRDKADEMQKASNSNNIKLFYSLLREVYGPSSSQITPLRSKDGEGLVRDPVDILKRWQEHFDELLNRPSTVDKEFLDSIPNSAIKDCLAEPPSFEEVKLSVKKLNAGKSPGMDGIHAELIKHGGENILRKLHNLILDVWTRETVPADWRDAVMVVLYKGKGSRDDCGNYRGIALLSAVGKVLCRILLDRLLNHVADDTLPESQSGFRTGRGTTDMIFSARQLQEKCIEQGRDLYQVFIDLTKAFDTVNRDALWEILRKLGCPEKFLAVLQSFHVGMRARVSVSGRISEPILVENGVKQGDILAPTLFALYFAMVFRVAFKNCKAGIYIRYRTSGKIFNIRRLSSKTKVFVSLIRDLLYADDCDLVTHTECDMQHLMDRFSKSCSALGLTISLKKTVVMFQPAPGKLYSEPNIYVCGKRLSVVDKFVYLGSTLNRVCTLDDEITHRLKRASVAFGSLEHRLWAQRGITMETKLKVYNACVLTALLYGCETWVVYRPHLRQLERFQQQCLRRIIGVHWEMRISDVEVLEKCHCESIEATILKHRLRWAGHVVRMGEERIPKQLLYGELAEGKRPPHKPKMRYRDCLKSSLKAAHISVDNWEAQAMERNSWRNTIHQGRRSFEEARIKYEKLKRSARKGFEFEFPTIKGDRLQLTCEICGRVCLSKAGKLSHLRKHRTMTKDYGNVGNDHIKICTICGKECKSEGGLKRHARIHKNYTVDSLACQLCSKNCKTLAGLKSHIRFRHK